MLLINGTNFPSGEFLLACVILAPLWKETVISIVRPYVRVYSVLALNNNISKFFHSTSAEEQTKSLGGFFFINQGDEKKTLVANSCSVLLI